MRARRLQQARLDEPLPWPASDAGRPVAIRSKRGSARRRPGARPRDSNDHSKALRSAPARLPQIVTLAPDTPHTSTRTGAQAPGERPLAAQTQTTHQ